MRRDLGIPPVMNSAPPPPAFTIETHELDREVTRVGLSGEVGLAVAAELRQRLDELINDGHPRLLVDLSDATFIDSTGLEVLLDTARQLRRPRGRFAVLCPDPDMRSLFQLVGHNLIFPVDESLDKALGHLVARPRFTRRPRQREL
jgi:anti-anti-sigma factor